MILYPKDRLDQMETLLIKLPPSERAALLEIISIKPSPTERATLFGQAAEYLADSLRSECDLADLMTIPVSMVSQLTGLSRSQVERTFTVRPMGKRMNGISMKALQQYYAKKS